MHNIDTYVYTVYNNRPKFILSKGSGTIPCNDIFDTFDICPLLSIMIWSSQLRLSHS